MGAIILLKKLFTTLGNINRDKYFVQCFYKIASKIGFWLPAKKMARPPSDFSEAKFGFQNLYNPAM